MKTELVVVISVLAGGDLDEIDNGVAGLIAKYGDRALGLRITSPSTPQSSQWKDYLSTDIELKEKCEFIRNSKSTSIGAYIVSHGSGNTVGALIAENLAALIGEVGFPTLRKLSLIACNVSANIDAMQQPTIDNSYVGNLCRELATFKLTPMIASYRAYVTVAYPGMVTKIFESTKGNVHLKGQALEGALKGRKLQKFTRFHNNKGGVNLMGITGSIKPKGEGERTVTARDELKIVLKWDGNNARIVPFDQWHDA